MDLTYIGNFSTISVPQLVLEKNTTGSQRPFVVFLLTDSHDKTPCKEYCIVFYQHYYSIRQETRAPKTLGMENTKHMENIQHKNILIPN